MTYPNRKSLKVFETLCGVPNRWIDVMEVACILDMTARQVSTAVMCLPDDLIKKERRNGVLQVRLDGRPEELTHKLLELRAMSLNVSDDMKTRVRSVLTSDWLTVEEICGLTGLSPVEVSNTLSVLENTALKYVGRVQLCRMAKIDA